MRCSSTRRSPPHYHREGKTREALDSRSSRSSSSIPRPSPTHQAGRAVLEGSMAREAIDEFGTRRRAAPQAGRTDDFMKVAERLLFHSPDNRPVTKELARLYIEKGDPRRALPKLQVCFKADPRDTEMLRLLAARVRGARSALEGGLGAQGAGAHPRRERRCARRAIEVYRQRSWQLRAAAIADAEAALSGRRRASRRPSRARATPPDAVPAPSPPPSVRARACRPIATGAQPVTMPASAAHEPVDDDGAGGARGER